MNRNFMTAAALRAPRSGWENDSQKKGLVW
jgi:hypothetical protein